MSVIYVFSLLNCNIMTLINSFDRLLGKGCLRDKGGGISLTAPKGSSSNISKYKISSDHIWFSFTKK